MKLKLLLGNVMALMVSSGSVLAGAPAGQGFSHLSTIQSIHVVNLVANANLPDLGMTPTPIIVRYYNGNLSPCWSSIIYYHEDDTARVNADYACKTKIDQVIIMPVVVAEKLKTYSGPLSVMIDTSKYSTTVLVSQDRAPSFDTQSGLITEPGTLKYQLQTELQ